jgi:hypothetical protein
MLNVVISLAAAPFTHVCHQQHAEPEKVAVTWSLGGS